MLYDSNHRLLTYRVRQKSSDGSDNVLQGGEKNQNWRTKIQFDSPCKISRNNSVEEQIIYNFV